MALWPSDSATDHATTIATYAGRETECADPARRRDAINVTRHCATRPDGTTIACSTAAGGTGAGNTITVNVKRAVHVLHAVHQRVLRQQPPDRRVVRPRRCWATPHRRSGPAAATCPPPVPSFTVAVTSGLRRPCDASASMPNSGTCKISGYNWDHGVTVPIRVPDSVGTASRRLLRLSRRGHVRRHARSDATRADRPPLSRNVTVGPSRRRHRAAPTRRRTPTPTHHQSVNGHDWSPTKRQTNSPTILSGLSDQPDRHVELQSTNGTRMMTAQAQNHGSRQSGATAATVNVEGTNRRDSDRSP